MYVCVQKKDHDLAKRSGGLWLSASDEDLWEHNLTTDHRRSLFKLHFPIACMFPPVKTNIGLGE